MASHVRPERVPAGVCHPLPTTIVPHARVGRLPTADVLRVDMLHQRVHVPQVLATPVPATGADLFRRVVVVRMRVCAGRRRNTARGVGGDVGGSWGGRVGSYWRMDGGGEGDGCGTFAGRWRG